MLKKITKSILMSLKSESAKNKAKIDELAEEIVSIDKVKEIYQLSAIISDFMKENERNNFDGLSREDVMRLALEGSDSMFYDNAYESWKNMPDDIRAEVNSLAQNHYMHKPNKEDIHGLAISGGGGKGQFYVGAIAALEKEGVLDKIKTFAGTSAGALTAIPLALGCGASELADIVRGTDFRAFFIESSLFKKNCHDALDTFMAKSRNANNLSVAFSATANKRQQAVIDRAFTEKDAAEHNMNQTFASEPEESRISVVMKHIEMTAKSANPDNNNSINKKVDGDGPVNNEYIKNGSIVKFLDIDLDMPLKTPFSSKFSEDLVDEIWKSAGIKEYASNAMEIYNGAIGFDYFENPRDVIAISVTKALSSDYIEYFLDDLVKKRVSSFVGHHGVDPLIAIHPTLEHHSMWSKLTMAQLGDLVKFDRASGNPFGMADLAIGVTRAKNRFNMVSGGKGSFVSSDMDKTDSVELSNLPISKIGRMSMSIPLVFKAVEHGNTKYVDGGLHNNLPTEYFDKHVNQTSFSSRLNQIGGNAFDIMSEWGDKSTHSEPYRFDKNILSIIPATASEISRASKVKDIFSIPEEFSVGEDTPFFSGKMVKEVISGLKNKAISVAAGAIIGMNNTAYKKMDEKSDFRNVLINTEGYGTMSFKVPRADHVGINLSSYFSVAGTSDDQKKAIAQKSIFANDYSATIRLMVAKVRYNIDSLGCNEENSNNSLMLKNNVGVRMNSPFANSRNNKKVLGMIESSQLIS